MWGCYSKKTHSDRELETRKKIKSIWPSKDFRSSKPQSWLIWKEFKNHLLFELFKGYGAGIYTCGIFWDKILLNMLFDYANDPMSSAAALLSSSPIAFLLMLARALSKSQDLLNRISIMDHAFSEIWNTTSLRETFSLDFAYKSCELYNISMFPE